VKKILIYVAGIALLLSAIAFAADNPASTTGKTDPAKVSPVKSAKMNATGKVVEITDQTIKIERTVKNNVETMEFILDKPAANIAVNDAVKIAYTAREGKLLASRVAKIAAKKIEKKDSVAGK